MTAQSSPPPLAAPDPAAEAAIAATLGELAGPGSFFTGAERIAIAEHVRSARGLGAATAASADLHPTIAANATRIATDAIGVRPHHLDSWQADGFDLLAYVELVAVVSTAVLVDSYRIGLGAPLDAFPTPVSGEPVPMIDERAVKTNAWVPTVGVALAPTALSALPNEKAAKARVAQTLYLTDEFVHKYDVEPGRELTRPQMELVAARTSWLNECFF